MASDADVDNLHGAAAAPSTTVLLLVDVVNTFEFAGGDALAEHAHAAAATLAGLKQRARQAGAACIYANDNFGRWRSNFGQLIEACRDTRGWPIVEQLLPEPDDYFVLKPKHSAFHATPIELLLRHLGTQRLVITGFAADNCVLFTAGDGFMREFEIVIPTDCIASEQPSWCAAAVGHMERVFKAEIVRAADIDFRASVPASSPPVQREA